MAFFSAFGPGLEALDLKREGTIVTATLDNKSIQTVAGAIIGRLAAARKAALNIATESRMRQILLGVIDYGIEYQKMPDKLDELAKYIGGDDAAATKRILTHPVTGEYPGFIYVKPAEKPGANSDTVVLWEAKDGKPNPEGYLGYADGSVRKATPAAAHPANP